MCASRMGEFRSTNGEFHLHHDQVYPVGRLGLRVEKHQSSSFLDTVQTTPYLFHLDDMYAVPKSDPRPIRQILLPAHNRHKHVTGTLDNETWDWKRMSGCRYISQAGAHRNDVCRNPTLDIALRLFVVLRLRHLGLQLNRSFRTLMSIIDHPTPG